MADRIALIAAVVLPLWNIPLIVRIVKRKSSRDISIFWALGVWMCLLLMAPSAFNSEDLVWRVFNIVNLSLFTMVVIMVLIYRRERKKDGFDED
ncbi:MAG: hypothetical protein GF375_01460 [Candidatus Omnitrophica bacterium]|nr:hypothetical protein [Candidatus Omnitrophota bacterium]MBD3268798.1 hypothetical protein [Candidatus Omnitrophota bacterium]